jgi:nitrite reductase/ring-hydroxylating ferredoxin subunit
MLVEVAKKSDIAPGGMKAVEVNGKEIVLCNCESDGRIYALERRCGHENGPLEMGTLDGYILTCPVHSVQFDIATGEALSKPIYHFSTDESEKEEDPDTFAQYFGELISRIKVHDVKTYPVKVEGDSIKIEV